MEVNRVQCFVVVDQLTIMFCNLLSRVENKRYFGKNLLFCFVFGPAQALALDQSLHFVLFFPYNGSQ